MSDMVERVAMAIFDQMHDGGYDNPYSASEETKTFYRKLARAAIEAMREPTELMVYAGHDVAEEAGKSGVRFAYTAMIDEALK